MSSSAERYRAHEGDDPQSGAAPASTDPIVSSTGEVLPVAPRRGRNPWIVPCGLAATYVLFLVAVHLRLLDNLDVSVNHAASPGGVWGPKQIRAARVVRALQPTHLAVPLLLVVAAFSLLRRSLRPLGSMLVVGVPVVVATLGSKWAMAHWDPTPGPVAHGSFPSGHMVSAVTAVGVLVLLLRPGTRWGWMLPAAMGCVMGSALVLAWVHPVSDVLGAGLLAAAALTAATAARLGQWANGSPRRGSEGVMAGRGRDSDRAVTGAALPQGTPPGVRGRPRVP